MIKNRRDFQWGGRLVEIMISAPWSSFDLALSAILILRGAYIIIAFEFLEVTYSYILYRQLSGWLSLQTYGWICLIAGLLQAISTLWPTRPPFEVRLMTRLSVCFCMLIFSLNQISNIPPPIGAITHFILALLSVWSVLRTSRTGG